MQKKKTVTLIYKMSGKRKPSPGRKTATAVKRKTAAIPPKTITATRKHGVYHNKPSQCAEITARFGRCLNDVKEGTMFCSTHHRKPQQHEDEFFDSTTAKVFDNIWIGSLDTANDPHALKAANIKTIVNISGWEPRTKTRELYKKMGINYYTTTTRDAMGKLHYLGDEPIKDQKSLHDFYCFMDRGVDLTRRAPKNGQILIHCHAGINRSASLVVAYLMSAKGMSYDKAEHYLKMANSKRKVPVLTNKHFVHHMKRYPQHLAAKKLLHSLTKK